MSVGASRLLHNKILMSLKVLKKTYHNYNSLLSSEFKKEL